MPRAPYPADWQLWEHPTLKLVSLGKRNLETLRCPWCEMRCERQDGHVLRSWLPDDAEVAEVQTYSFSAMLADAGKQLDVTAASLVMLVEGPNGPEIKVLWTESPLTELVTLTRAASLKADAVLALAMESPDAVPEAKA